MSKMAESSSQAIERYLAEQLAGLKLDVPAEEVEFMARFVEEEGLEVSEKVEGVRGMLEGVVEVSHFAMSLTPDAPRWGRSDIDRRCPGMGQDTSARRSRGSRRAFTFTIT